MDFEKMSEEKLSEYIEKRFGKDAKNWNPDDPAVKAFFERIAQGED